MCVIVVDEPEDDADFDEIVAALADARCEREAHTPGGTVRLYEHPFAAGWVVIVRTDAHGTPVELIEGLRAEGDLTFRASIA